MKKVLIILCCFSLVGCATVQTAPMEPERSTVVINASKDTVWPLIIKEVGLNYPIQVVEKESGLITTQFVQMPVGINNKGMEKYIFPPGGFLSTWSGLKMNLRVIAQAQEDNKTLVTINAHYEAYESNVRKAWVVASSNGSVENSIITNVERQIE